MNSSLTPNEKLKAAFARSPDPVGLSIEEQRAATEGLIQYNPPASDIAFETVATKKLRGAWIKTPTSQDQRVILYIHGGAFVAGSAMTHLSLAGELARAASARVFSVDYRLAPEAPFPSGYDDCVSAYEEIASMPGVASFAVAGDSAGGGLALSTLMYARDQKWQLPTATVLFSPWADLSRDKECDAALESKDLVLSHAFLKKMAGLYLGDKDPSAPEASPAHGRFKDLPPMLIQVSNAEILLNDARLIEKNAARAGASIELDIWPDMLHVWQGFTKVLPQAKDALVKAGGFISAQWS